MPTQVRILHLPPGGEGRSPRRLPVGGPSSLSDGVRAIPGRSWRGSRRFAATLAPGAGWLGWAGTRRAHVVRVGESLSTVVPVLDADGADADKLLHRPVHRIGHVRIQQPPGNYREAVLYDQVCRLVTHPTDFTSRNRPGVDAEHCARVRNHSTWRTSPRHPTLSRGVRPHRARIQPVG